LTDADAITTLTAAIATTALAASNFALAVIGFGVSDPQTSENHNWKYTMQWGLLYLAGIAVLAHCTPVASATLGTAASSISWIPIGLAAVAVCAIAQGLRRTLRTQNMWSYVKNITKRLASCILQVPTCSKSIISVV
jgi:uncharacterized membrane protein HdeD (DUF308 family)